MFPLSNSFDYVSIHLFVCVNISYRFITVKRQYIKIDEEKRSEIKEPPVGKVMFTKKIMKWAMMSNMNLMLSMQRIERDIEYV